MTQQSESDRSFGDQSTIVGDQKTGSPSTFASDLSFTKRRKLLDLTALLPIAGVLLLATPFVSIFTGGDESGVAGSAIYIFGVWAILIACAFVLARLLAKQNAPDIDPEPED
jgi:hypothetical protein